MPKRSAMAPAIGWPRPHNRFCSASARPKTSRPQVNSRLIGWMKKPRLERGPKLNSAIKHPQMMMTSGVRQVPGPEDGLISLVVAAMCFPLTIGARNRRAKCYDELMHLHEKPKGRSKNSRCRAALQNQRVQSGGRPEQFSGVGRSPDGAERNPGWSQNADDPASDYATLHPGYGTMSLPFR